MRLASIRLISHYVTFRKYKLNSLPALDVVSGYDVAALQGRAAFQVRWKTDEEGMEALPFTTG